MLLCVDPSRAEHDLTTEALSCPHQGCDGRLGPWGHARSRTVRARGVAFSGTGLGEGVVGRAGGPRSFCRRAAILAGLTL